MARENNVRNGVLDAMSGWLYEHSVTTPNCVVEGVQNAFRDWLEKHRDEVIDALAKECAKRQAETRNK